MAKTEKEAIFCDETIHAIILNAANIQRKTCTFCDVILKVYSREIYAHSNILSAASPYFENFLGQDLPRCFSQRTAQLVEIQIEGNEHSQPFEDAVEEIVNYIYTGYLDLRQSNVGQVLEMSRVMKLYKVAKMCEEFMLGVIGHNTICKVPGKGVMNSVAVNTEWTGLKMFKELPVLDKLVNNTKQVDSKSVQTSQRSNATTFTILTDDNKSLVQKLNDDKPSNELQEQTKHVYHFIHSEDSSTVPSGNKTSKLYLVDKARESNESGSDSNYTDDESSSLSKPVIVFEQKGASEAQIKPLDTIDDVDHAMEIDESALGTDSLDESNDTRAPPRRSKVITYLKTRAPRKKPKVYNCSEREYTSYIARMLSSHQMNHKYNDNVCYYCDLRFDDTQELTDHVKTHSSPAPFHCTQCDAVFKTRTLLNQHKPVHSDDKPYVCEVNSCSLS